MTEVHDRQTGPAAGGAPLGRQRVRLGAADAQHLGRFLHRQQRRQTVTHGHNLRPFPTWVTTVPCDKCSRTVPAQSTSRVLWPPCPAAETPRTPAAPAAGGRPQPSRRLQRPRRPRATGLDPRRVRRPARALPRPTPDPSRHLRHRTGLGRRPAPRVRRPRTVRLRPGVRPAHAVVPAAAARRPPAHAPPPPGPSTSSTCTCSAGPNNSSPCTRGCTRSASPTPPPPNRPSRRSPATPARSRQWSYRERRKELLLALLDQHADDLDNAIDELGRQLDHLRQVGIRGFIAEHTNDDDYARPGQRGNEAAAAGTAGETAPGDTRGKRKSARKIAHKK